VPPTGGTPDGPRPASALATLVTGGSKGVVMSAMLDLDPRNSVEIDLGGAAFKAQARQHLAEWAKRPPFYVLNQGPPQVIVGRHADALEVFTDPVRFSSEVPRGRGYEQFDKFMGGKGITQMDGEQHARLRRLVMPAFSSRRVAQLEARIAEIIAELLDDIERGGREFDAMQHYAAKLVVGALLTAMLNLSASQKRVLLDFQEVQPQLTSVKPGQPWPPECLDAYERYSAVVKEIIADRRANPRSDFVSDLVLARDDGDKLDDRELFDLIFAMCAALATTPRSGSGALHLLYSHRDQLEQLLADPSLIPDAVDECLRIAGNGYFTFPRVATIDTSVGGTAIGKGMIVRPSPQAANFDPEVFPDPLRFDIHRKPKMIMTFGAGPHRCIGSHLAHTTISLALRMLLARFPDARLADPDFQPVYGGAVGELRMKTLPMVTD
jgi:cytochrome P450